MFNLARVFSHISEDWYAIKTAKEPVFHISIYYYQKFKEKIMNDELIPLLHPDYDKTLQVPAIFFCYSL